jgi:TRAP-type C4-dicarboxylate transport system permease small subunit
MLRGTHHLAIAGTIAFLVAVALTVTDIVLRSVSTLTVQGLTDIVTLCTMVGAMLAIPYGFAADQHVSIDVFTGRMPRAVQRWLRMAAAILSLAFLGGAAWFGCVQMLSAYHYGDRSQSIGIPMVWYWIPLLIGIALSAAVNAWLIVREIRTPAREA